MKKLDVIVIGAGDRGKQYSAVMKDMPEKYTIVGMADPQESRRMYFQQNFGVPADKCYNGWEEILALPKMADVALISTVDNMHYEPALAAIEKGYHLLLEKPVAQTAQECVDIAIAAKKKGVRVLVCHVLRYTPFYGSIKELLMQGAIGDVISMDMVEAIGNMHFSHSYTRGNWHSEAESTPMLLAKSCHDLDMAQWLLDKSCKYVSSFGNLFYFNEKNAPEGAPARCTDGNCPIEDTCRFNSVRYYHDRKDNFWRDTITQKIAKSTTPTDEEIMQALKTNDYGRCVYRCNNDVADHQVVSMEFEGGITVNFTVNAFNQGGRYIRVYGTKGELWAYASMPNIQMFTFDDEKIVEIPVEETEESIKAGHGGGDYGIITELYDYLVEDYNGYRAADIETSVKNHLIGFAAETARHNRTVEDVQALIRQYGLED